MATTTNIPSGDDGRQLALYLLDTYFKTQPYVFTKHHLDSYDQFLSQDLPTMIRTENPILVLKDRIQNTDDYRYKVEIYIGGVDGSAIEIGLPTVALQNTEEVRLLFPNEARLRNLTYSSLVLADILCKISILTPGSSTGGLPDIQVHERVFTRFPLFRIPIMLHSRYCNLHNKSAEFLEEAGEDPQDYGGYFIVDGSEKVLITKQEQAFNTLYINKQNHDPQVSHFASISCLSQQTRQVKRVSFYYMREVTKKGGKIQFDTLHVGLPFVRKSIPIFILFRALGYQTDEEIVRLIFPDAHSPETALLESYIVNSINEAFPFLDTYSAIQYIKSLTKGFSEAHVLDVLTNQFFIHIPDSRMAVAAKAAFLGDCARRIIRVVAGLDPKTDKDDIRNQRCLVSGFSTQMLFSGIYEQWRKGIVRTIDEQYNFNQKLYSGLNFLNIFAPGNTNLIFKPLFITDSLMRAFKGRWGSGMGEEKAGLIQQLSRMSYLDFMSHCRRVVLDFDTGMKLTGPRHLHPSQFGYFCTNEVPSGAAIGITKNLSILTAISTASISTIVADFLLRRRWVIPCAQATDEQRSAFIPFFINGGLLGYTTEPVKLVAVLRLMKRTACLAPLSSVGFSISGRRVFLYMDEGRPLRPLIHLSNNGAEGAEGAESFPIQKIQKLKTWRELVCGTIRANATVSSTDFYDPFHDRIATAQPSLDEYIEFLTPHTGVIEYLDPYESNEAYIATFPDYITRESTHVEIHPSTILSILTGIIPFPNHNQSPRNQLGDSQSKQGLSLYATNWQNRFDNQAHVLAYGEAPLVRTIYYDYIGNGKMSYGYNCILAIASFTGYNQEDGIVMNHDSVMRGMFRSLAYKSYEAFEEDDPMSKAKTRIGNPSKIPAWTDIKPGVDYGKLDDNGIVRVGEYVDETTVICGRYIQLPGGKIQDASVTGQVWTRGRVEKIAITVSPVGLRTVKLRVVQDRTPELGDKFCLSPDHYVLTEARGWVPIGEITLQDKVMQYDLKTNTSSFEHPIEVYVFNHEGYMVEVKTPASLYGEISIKATMNHRMIVKGPDGKPVLRAVRDLLLRDHEYLNDPDRSIYWQNPTDFALSEWITVKKDDYTATPYKGVVHCLRVPTEVFLVRRGERGQPLWTGNSNRHGQKGTLGMLVRAHDMPRTATGITPDFIMNPHAIPSRMTIGQIIENIMGKTAANVGAIGNGTAFMNQGSPHEELGKTLERYGFEKYCNEILYNGMTGEQIPSAIFIAPVFAMRLKHMTEDKWNARGEGRREQRTHQPTGGRGNQGGLRMGEMERDAVSGHGIAVFTQESYMKRSDGTATYVCEGCGIIPIYNERQGLYVCPTCDGPIIFGGEGTNNVDLIPPVKRAKAAFSRVEMPYATMLLAQEMAAYMNISTRYLTQKGLRHLGTVKMNENEGPVDLALINAPLPVRVVPQIVNTPAETSVTQESVMDTVMSAVTGQQPQQQQTPIQSQQQPQQTQPYKPVDDLSALPQIPEDLRNIAPLSSILVGDTDDAQQQQQQTQQQQPIQYQEVKLMMPSTLAQPQQSQQPQTLTEQLASAPIGSAPAPVQGQVPAPPPPAQILTTSTSVNPTIFVDTTPASLIAEGLPQGPQILPQKPKTYKIKRPQQQGGEDEDENSNSKTQYSQNVSFVKLA